MTGERFARALAAKDGTALRALLAEDVDFRGMTPNRYWDATGAGAVIDILLGAWFEPDDRIEELISVGGTGGVADREHVVYRLRGRNATGEFLVEQQMYYTAAAGRIAWMRVLCSGFRPVQGNGEDR